MKTEKTQLGRKAEEVRLGVSGMVEVGVVLGVWVVNVEVLVIGSRCVSSVSVSSVVVSGVVESGKCTSGECGLDM